MITLVRDFTLPAMYSLLPSPMQSMGASAMILAIGLQESNFGTRRQGDNGPARGFWQFEKAGVKGVSQHQHTRAFLHSALTHLRYHTAVGQTAQLHAIIEHNDVLACLLARLLLWTLPARLPTRTEPDEAWRQYLEGWRPGRPRRDSWNAYYTTAWQRLDEQIGETHERPEYPG